MILKYFLIALIWTIILAFIEYIGVYSGMWKYKNEETSRLGKWSFLKFYWTVYLAGFIITIIIDIYVTGEDLFLDGFIQFSLGSIMAMIMQVCRLLDMFEYTHPKWNVVCCWILQTSQIILLWFLTKVVFAAF